MSYRDTDADGGADRHRRTAGFTLIELLVVVTILGILVAIAIPLYLNYQRSTSDKAAQSDVRAAITVLDQCEAENAAYPQPSAVTYDTDNGACTDRRINTSSGSTLIYTSVAPYTSFMIVGYSSNGNASSNGYGRRTYCYNSSTGGTVTALTGLATTC